jgi:pyruvate dehydrogenase E2 component (dihydrolipoamide acetyltransferase)
VSSVTMPSLAEAMRDGVIGRWLKREGERVERDEELVEIETDKVTVAFAAPDSGYLEIVASEGTTVAVGGEIARLVAAPPSGAPAPAPALPSDPEPAAASASPAPPVPGLEAPDSETLAFPGVRATPLARQLASRHGLALDAVSGSGPGGRVRRGDVAARLGLAPPPDAEATAAAKAEPDVEQLSRLQRTVARRMSEAHAVIPDFQVETEVAMDAALALREELKRVAGEDTVPSLNDLVIRASALALRRHPRVNATYAEDRLLLLPVIDVGFAVAAEEALLVPAVRGADARSLLEIAAETARLVARVREGTITPAELAPASFTVSNLGMFGMTAITPIVDPPQLAILGVGSIRDTLALAGGAVVERKLMTLRLSCDHRALYGADAARFLSTIRELLEQPLRLLL